MRVTLLTDLEPLIQKMYQAARTCYSTESPLKETKFEKKQLCLIRKCFDAGHLSIAEHANVTFFIEGISRACSHQLVRHRHMSFSQQSQRYVNFSNVGFYEPDSIYKNAEADAIYNEFLTQCTKVYDILCDLGIKKEDARYVLPNAAISNITVTMNLRAFIEFCNKRLCSRAQAEIRTLAREMAQEIIAKQDWLASYLVPNCLKLGYCPEEKSCGVKPVKERFAQKAHVE